MKKFISLIALAILLVGCIGIETETTFNRDGSGSMTFTYQLSSTLLQMGAEESGVALPFDQESLEDSLEGADGVTLKSVETWEEGDDTFISANIDFESVDSFYEQDEYNDMAASLVRTASGFKYCQMISEGNGEPTEEDAAASAMMAPYFEGYMVTMIINAPSKIKTYNMGELSNGGKTLTYEITMLELSSMADETYLDVSW